LYCSLNGACYIQHQGKILHRRWTAVFQLEWSVLQWTLFWRYFTTSGQWSCTLNGECYIEHYAEDTSQQVDSGIAAWMECYSEHYREDTSQQVDSGIAVWMECFTVHIILKILHNRWIVVLHLEGSVLQWTLRKTLHRRWTAVFQLEWSVLQWTLCGRYFTEGGQWYCTLNGVCYSEH
jgi:hypothetical protein